MPRERVKRENLSIVKEKPRKETFYFDYSLLLVMMFLILFGLVMVYSASYYEAMTTASIGDPTYYVKRQATATALGLVGMYVVYRIPYQNYRKLGYIPYILCYIVIFMIIPFGYEANGARRWIELGPIRFQAAEPVKLGMIVFFANFIYGYRKKLNSFKTMLIMLGLTAPVSFLVWQLTENMSSALIIAAICVVMIFVASKDYKRFIALGLAAVAAAAGAVYFIVWMAENSGADATGVRGERILAWLDLESYASGKGYQTLQALYAIGSGGIWGKGLGQSIQKLDFLPEAQNDMIFSIICEELGLFGGIAVILMFIIMIWRMAIIASHAADLQGSMLVVGVMAHISVQVILNVAVVTNTIPNTGISLPFISYGGTSVCFLMLEMGLVFSVARGIRVTNYDD